MWVKSFVFIELLLSYLVVDQGIEVSDVILSFVACYLSIALRFEVCWGL